MVALVLVDLVGGIWAARSGVNTWAEAWGSKALLAAPAPMIAFQVLATALAVRGGRWVGGIAAALLALACLVSVVSGFFDGGLGNDELEPGMGAFQVLLLVVTGVVGVLAGARAVLRAGLSPSAARSSRPG
jgi:hypothetical protein